MKSQGKARRASPPPRGVKMSSFAKYDKSDNTKSHIVTILRNNSFFCDAQPKPRPDFSKLTKPQLIAGFFDETTLHGRYGAIYDGYELNMGNLEDFMAGEPLEVPEGYEVEVVSRGQSMCTRHFRGVKSMERWLLEQGWTLDNGDYSYPSMLLKTENGHLYEAHVTRGWKEITFKDIQ